ncbi:MAG: flagellar biosynthetic protein FliR [Oscillospiraceae bacterium]|nr:flagellar biosynthetic protein FliR [Oscillospiraceae bacterium]
MVKVGLTLALSVLLTVYSTVEVPQITNMFEFIIRGIVEFAIGYSIALIMNIFLSSILVATDFIDTQLGIGMAKVFDPGSNVSAAVTGSIYYGFIILLFFVTNGHITLFKLLSDTIVAIPCGSDVNLTNLGLAIAGMLGSALVLAAKFALPITAVELVSEIGMGVLTRAVPHLNIFSIGIQLKLLIGIVVLVLLAPAFGSFCDGLYAEMFQKITSGLKILQNT